MGIQTSRENNPPMRDRGLPQETGVDRWGTGYTNEKLRSTPRGRSLQSWTGHTTEEPSATVRYRFFWWRTVIYLFRHCQTRTKILFSRNWICKFVPCKCHFILVILFFIDHPLSVHSRFSSICGPPKFLRSKSPSISYAELSLRFGQIINRSPKNSLLPASYYTFFAQVQH